MNKKRGIIIGCVVVWLWVVVELFQNSMLEFENKVSLEALATVAGLYFAGYTLHEGRKEWREAFVKERAAFIKDYVSTFYTNKDLFDAFYELIHNYKNKDFEKVDHLYHDLTKRLGRPPDYEELKNEVFELGVLPKSTKVFYHPANFQGTEIERRVDAVLGYFDVIGYYCKRGLITVEDLRGILGYYIEALNNSWVMNKYYQLITEAYVNWETKYGQSYPNKPCTYTRQLPEMIGLRRPAPMPPYIPSVPQTPLSIMVPGAPPYPQRRGGNYLD